MMGVRDRTPLNSTASGAARRSAPPLLTLLLPWTGSAVIAGAIYTGGIAASWGFLALLLFLLGPFWTFRSHSPSILLVFIAVLLGGVLTSHPVPKLRGDELGHAAGTDLSRRWSEAGPFKSELPIVLHLVFDEFMSLGALPPDLPSAATLRTDAQALGERHSFRLFDSVYSRHFFSGESLPNLMSAEFRGQTALEDLTHEIQEDFRQNDYFAQLEQRGYRTAVFQTSHLDFCGSEAVDLCETFDSFDPSPDRNGDARNRTAALWRALAGSYEPSITAQLGKNAIDRAYGLRGAELGVLGLVDRYDVQGFPGWFDRFITFAANVPRGTHVFAHLMVPHAPYLLTSNCIVSGRFEAGYYLVTRYAADAREEHRRRFYEAYAAQAGCVLQKLDALLETISGLEQYHDATIIVHGDHGSRISSGNVLEEMTEQDFIDNYATFFAVRAPSVPAGIDCEFLTLGEAFRRVLGNDDPRPAMSNRQVAVMSREAGGAKIGASMPVFGCATDER